jgi:hypothetical protein
MRVKPLRSSVSPDVPDFLIHMTGRFGPKAGSLPNGVGDMPPVDRLAGILTNRALFAGLQFGASWPSVCFTQTTPSALAELCTVVDTKPMRYDGCGIAFHVQSVFNAGGGPALYVRGDEWDTLRGAADLSWRLKARAVRYWPGAEPEPGEELPMPVWNESQWLHEREWRLPAPENAVLPWSWRFQQADVAFILLSEQQDVAQFHRRFADDYRNRWVQSLPVVTMRGGQWHDRQGRSGWVEART